MVRNALVVAIAGVFAFATCGLQVSAASNTGDQQGLNPAANNGATIKISSTKTLELTRDDSVTLSVSTKNLKKNVKWMLTDPVSVDSIVSIEKKFGKKKSKVTILAKNEGECTLMAKATYKKKGKLKKRTFKCKITVKKPEPKPINSKDLSEGYTWDPNLGTPVTKDTAVFNEAYANFSFELLRNVNKMDIAMNKSENQLISPDSILTALVMVENGAEKETLDEMVTVLGKDVPAADYNKYMAGLNNRLTSSDVAKYKVANAIWADEDENLIQKDFIKINKEHHNAPFYLVKFDSSVIEDINNWASNNTEGLIKEIVSDDILTPELRMLLLNAVLFEDQWLMPFNDPSTDTFRGASGDEFVKMLSQAEAFDYFEVNGGKAFVKPYAGGKFAFVGIEPPSEESIDEFVDTLHGKEFMAKWNLKSNELVDIKLPEFKYEYSASLKEPLMAMGIYEAFDKSMADFGGIFKSQGPQDVTYISDVLHKTYIELDKNGTKAAAVTAVIVDKATSTPEQQYKKVHLDHPFVYAIVDYETGLPLFLGIVRDLQ